MDSKKGIRIKTKQVSLVDNIVNFFKPIDLKANPNPQPHQQDRSMDASPRSTTPRKKIFDKTPEKAGKINLSNLNNKSMDHAYEITFNDQLKGLKEQQSRSQLSPPKRFLKPNTFEDTQFNKLILGNSQVSIKKLLTTEKTFLNDVPLNHSINTNNQPQKGNAPFPRVQGGLNRQAEKQLEHHKKLLRQCLSENEHLKRDNQRLRDEVQSLRKVVKSYELSSIAHNVVPVVTLQPQNMTSPLQKVSPFASQNKTLIGYQTEKSFEQNEKKKQKMKQSIPIMPQIPSEYNEKGRSPQIGETSFLSSDLKNRSHDGSFLQSQKSYENLPGFSVSNHNQNDRVLLPLEKTVYDRTMKPQQRQRKAKPKQEKEQISFSKTVGYIKGDQPVVSNKNPQTNKNNNPFEEIATESNKFLFQNGNNQSASNNSFRVQQKSNKGFNGREWVVFTQGQSSLGYSSNSNSVSSFNRQSVLPNNFTKQNKMEPQKHQNLDRSKDSKMRSPKHQHSVTQNMKIEGSKTYKFQDFDPNDEDSSYVDYF